MNTLIVGNTGMGKTMAVKHELMNTINPVILISQYPQEYKDVIESEQIKYGAVDVPHGDVIDEILEIMNSDALQFVDFVMESNASKEAEQAVERLIREQIAGEDQNKTWDIVFDGVIYNDLLNNLLPLTQKLNCNIIQTAQSPSLLPLQAMGNFHQVVTYYLASEKDVRLISSPAGIFATDAKRVHARLMSSLAGTLTTNTDFEHVLSEADIKNLGHGETYLIKQGEKPERYCFGGNMPSLFI